MSVTACSAFSEQDARRQLGGLLAMIPMLNQFVVAAEQVKLKEEHSPTG